MSYYRRTVYVHTCRLIIGVRIKMVRQSYELTKSVGNQNIPMWKTDFAIAIYVKEQQFTGSMVVHVNTESLTTRLVKPSANKGSTQMFSTRDSQSSFTNTGFIPY